MRLHQWLISLLFFLFILQQTQVFAYDMTEIKAQLNKLIQTVDSLNSTVKAQQNKIDSQQHEIESLKDLRSGLGSQPTPIATQAQIQTLDSKLNKVVEAQKKTLMSEFNPSIGFVGESIGSYSSKNSKATGNDRPGGFDFNQRSMELDLAASVDPFATGYAVINASADTATGEAKLGVEEAAAQTTSLPWNLTLKGGRFFGEFGRLAYIHDHELPFVNRPLALDKYIGGESQTDGLQASWLLPIEHYVNLTLGIGDKFGDPQNNPGAYRAFSELNSFGRLSTYFDVTPNWQVETGVSGLFNPSTNDRGGVLVQPNGSTLTERERRLVGLDFSLRYVPLRNNQFRSLTWGNELLFSDNRYRSDSDAVTDSGDESSKSIGSWGGYSYLAYKIDRQWTVGSLFDFVSNPENASDKTYAPAVYLTYALSHWSQLRLQYTHTTHSPGSNLRDNDAIYLQWSWIIGSHSHGWQSR